MSDDPRPGDGGVSRGPDARPSSPGDALVVSASTETDPEHGNLSVISPLSAILLVLPDLTLRVQVPSLVLTRKPIISSGILLRLATVEALDHPPVPLYLAEVSDGLDSVLRPGHTPVTPGLLCPRNESGPTCHPVDSWTYIYVLSCRASHPRTDC